MLRVKLNIGIPLLFLLGACSAGVQKDLTTGLTVGNKNLTYEKAYIKKDGVNMDEPNVNVGAKLQLMMEGVSGFKEENNRAFPGCSILVTDKEGNVEMKYDDLFEQYNKEGVSPDDVAYLNSSLTIGDPLVAGKTYKWTSRFWDKKGDGEITAAIELSVIE